MKTSVRKKAIFWIILLAIAALPIVLCETFFYIKFRNDYGKQGYTKSHLAQGRIQDSPHSIYEPIPNTINLKSGFRQNNYGFRDEEDTQPKKDNEFRVFILGGSGAIGQGAMQQFIQISGQQEYPSKYTISAYLEEKLRNELSGVHVEVINAAVSGYKVHQEYSAYLGLLRNLDPDLLVLIDGYNDIFFPLDGKFNVNELDRGAWENHTYKTNITYRYGMWLMSKSYTFFYLGKLLFTSKYEYEEDIYNKWLNAPNALDTTALKARFHEKFAEIEYGLDDLFKRYEIFRRTCEVDSVDILFCPQPLLAIKPQKTEMEVSLYNYLLSELGEDEEMCHHTAYTHYLSRFDQWAARDSLNYLNLQTEIDKSSDQIFVDYCHLSFTGNELVADLVKDKILEMGIVSGR